MLDLVNFSQTGLIEMIKKIHFHLLKNEQL